MPHVEREPNGCCRVNSDVLVLCEGEVIVQGDESLVCGVAQVVDCHGVTVGHQEREEEEEQQEVEGEGEEHSKNTAHVHGWDDYGKTSASGLGFPVLS